MPDVMTKTEIQELTDEEWKMVHATVLDAISHLVDFRKQEGAAPVSYTHLIIPAILT